jgi:hypothetical protein
MKNDVLIIDTTAYFWVWDPFVSLSCMSNWEQVKFCEWKHGKTNSGDASPSQFVYLANFWPEKHDALVIVGLVFFLLSLWSSSHIFLLQTKNWHVQLRNKAENYAWHLYENNKSVVMCKSWCYETSGFSLFEKFLVISSYSWCNFPSHCCI